MEEIKLKPCPFCGAPGKMRSSGMHWYVMRSGDADDCPVLPLAGFYESREKAAEAWNRRAC